MNPPYEMSGLIPGQRFLSQTEPELGLGTLLSFDARTLTLEFPASESTRCYSRAAAPVQRVRFKAGDRITDRDGNGMIVETVETEAGLLVYGTDDGRVISETDLADSLAVDLPFERLLAGLAGPPEYFDLRCRIQEALTEYQASPVRGLLGGQVDLIPHQIYIAHEVGSRYYPRVLLSDETGLGKTVEAGLILHHLLVTGRMSRVLIIVPNPLVHQWFIELYRKFSLTFRIFDRDYVEAARESEPGMNPFTLDQLGICSEDFIRSAGGVKEALTDASWDMVVMDEAHHMSDDEGFYGFMTRLGRKTRGLLLLTATPEQMGGETHFAQLQLLDPARYHDFDTFVREAKGYQDAAEDIRRKVAAGEPFEHLLDAFGPGRVIFRNRRRSVKGFPHRNVNLIPLTESGEGYSGDSRVACLADLSRSLKPEKILVICKSKADVDGIIQGLSAHVAVDAARFDETMDLLQRDRQAAWFADPSGARLLVCSEIGSEGRNFQFARHLFLFDLPENPELLEQRIGRVDRIGQKQTIVIHVPYIRNSSQEVLALWYDRGIGQFRENVNGLHAVFTRFGPRVSALLAQAGRGELSARGRQRMALEELITDTADFVIELAHTLDQGRHILLEMNSFKREPAQKLVRAIRDTEQAGALARLMEDVFDRYGVETEGIDEVRGHAVVSFTPDRVTDENFTALIGDGRFATFDRACAIARDDLDFLTWDHPFVDRVLSYFITQGEGRAAVARLEGAGKPMVLLESLFLLDLPGDGGLSSVGLPDTVSFRILVDHGGIGLDPCEVLDGFRLVPDNPAWFRDLPELAREMLPAMLAQSQARAEDRALELRREYRERLSRVMGRERARLAALARVNPGITELEIRALQEEQERMAGRIANARVRLDGVRLIRSLP